MSGAFSACSNTLTSALPPAATSVIFFFFFFLLFLTLSLRVCVCVCSCASRGHCLHHPAEYEALEVKRPQFVNNPLVSNIPSPVTGLPVEYFDPKTKRNRVVFSWITITALIIIVLAAIFSIFVLRLFFVSLEDDGTIPKVCLSHQRTPTHTCVVVVCVFVVYVFCFVCLSFRCVASNSGWLACHRLGVVGCAGCAGCAGC